MKVKVYKDKFTGEIFRYAEDSTVRMPSAMEFLGYELISLRNEDLSEKETAQ